MGVIASGESDEAIHSRVAVWIASLAMTKSRHPEVRGA
jgi:hypothetical protein